MKKPFAQQPHGEEPEPAVHVTDTGTADSSTGGKAVTGYQGPDPAAASRGTAPVHVSHTGPATATDGGIAITGHVGTLIVPPRPLREPASWPHQVGVVPGAARSFQHRVEADRLRATVEGGGTTLLTQLLTGMGGVGKTQLAADYARTAWNDGEVDVLVWVTAAAQTSVVGAYAQAGVELCRADPEDPERAARQFLAWLAPKPGQEPCRWLIVLDDLADPADLLVHADDPAGRFSLWPPANPHGRTLVTTRRRDAALFGEGRRRVDVGLFTPTESAAYLTASMTSHGRTEDAEQLVALADDLGHLPLALAQAAAYIIDSGKTTAAYRTLLADRTTKLARLSPTTLPDEQATALHATWSLSVERANALPPVGLAEPMLHLTAFLDPNGIPQDVLTGHAALTHLAQHRIPGTQPVLRRRWWQRKRPTPASAPPVAPDEGFDALRTLDRLGLIDHTPAAPSHAVRVHQLVQRATHDTHAPDQNRGTARVAADALIGIWPDVENDTAFAQTLRANAQALSQRAEDALCQPDGHAVLFRFGQSLSRSGQTSAAIDHYERLVASLRSQLHPDHPDTFTARSNLASCRGEAGDPTGAVQAFAELLTDRERVLGNDHPSTLTTRGNLASWQGEAGDPAGAAQALAELLTLQNRVLGNDHPDTLTTRGNLASWRGEAGDPAGAAQALAELLTHERHILGDDHPDTLTTRSNLASCRGQAGDPAGAVQAFAELLTHERRILGDDHPSTLTTRGNLASWRGEAGDPAGAAQAFAELLTDRQRVLGNDHPSTLATRGNLASWRGEAGDPAGAAQAFAELLTDRQRVLGNDHPDTLNTRGNLASWRGKAGDPAGAAQAFAELLTDRQRVLGNDHPGTLNTRGNLASWRGKAGDPAGAAQAFTELLTHERRILGDDHPDTLTTRGNLATWRGEAGDPAGAAQALTELLTDAVRVLGAEHPRVEAVHRAAAYWREKAERGS
ncbi:tetratricopeptide repeat protein [Streptomyces goshikiensis]|uniref:tetratricopeptide repeat protein n=1 Tax=Streptomyces goshikiensis TaxID=1942 RepID=UPI0036AD739D